MLGFLPKDVCSGMLQQVYAHQNLQEWYLWQAAPWGYWPTLFVVEIIFSCRHLRYHSCFLGFHSLCFKIMQLWLLWWLCVLVLHLCLQLSWWPLLMWASQQLWVRKMWFCYHCWCQGHPTGPQLLPQSHIPFQTYADFAMGPPQVSFFFRVDPPTSLSIYVDVCCSVSFLHSGSNADTFSTNVGHNCWDLHHCNPVDHTHGRNMCILAMVWDPHQECTKWLLPQLLWVEGALCYSISFPSTNPAVWWGVNHWRLGRVTYPPAFPTWLVGIFSSGFGSTWWHDEL